jgi:DNA-binding transcriptional ArsR family regulator
MVTQQRADLVFKALSDPTRRSILTSLQGQSLAVATVSQSFPKISRPAISKHLRILREAGLVAEEQQGRQRFYRFVEGSLEEAGAWVGTFAAGPAASQQFAGRAGKRQTVRLQAPMNSDGWRVW